MESSNSQERELHHLQQMQDNAKESCMTSFQLLYSFLHVLSYDESKSKRVSECAFMTLFGQDNETFTSTMFLYVDPLQNQLGKDEFQEDKSMAAFWVLNNHFQKFIDWQYFLDYDSEMTEKLFAEYTIIKVKQFRKTLLLHMGNCMKMLIDTNKSPVVAADTEVEVVVNKRKGKPKVDDAVVAEVVAEVVVAVKVALAVVVVVVEKEVVVDNAVVVVEKTYVVAEED
nr:hypothetical protein [Tanacetum cinerariifolium]